MADLRVSSIMMVVLFIKKIRCMRDETTLRGSRIERQTEINGMIIKIPVKKWSR